MTSDTDSGTLYFIPGVLLTATVSAPYVTLPKSLPHKDLNLLFTLPYSLCIMCAVLVSALSPQNYGACYECL
jgi:hypothetical protein